MIGISMRFKARVKLNHLLSQTGSMFKDMRSLFNRTTASCSRECSTHLKHYLCVVFFDPKIRNKHFRNIGQKISCHVQFIGKVVSVFHLFCIKLCNPTSERMKYPFKNFPTIVRYFQNAVVIGISISSAVGSIDVMANEETAFTVDKSGQISQIEGSNSTQIVRLKFWHEKPLILDCYSLNERTVVVTLNDLTIRPFLGMRKSDLRLYIKSQREIRRGFPAWKQVTKVTDCLNESARLLAQNLAQTMDEVTRDVLASTSSVLLCQNGINGQTPTELTKPDIDSAVKTLLGNDAEMISEVVTASNQIGTTPIRPAFWGYIDTGLLDDLESVANFVSSSQYPGNQNVVLDSEWGATGNVRWLYTSVGSVSAAATPVYNNFIVGKEAYAVVNLRSETGDFYIKPLGSAGAADPLNQRGSVGWQHPFVSRILNDAFMVNLMASHS